MLKNLADPDSINKQNDHTLVCGSSFLSSSLGAATFFPPASWLSYNANASSPSRAQDACALQFGAYHKNLVPLPHPPETLTLSEAAYSQHNLAALLNLTLSAPLGTTDPHGNRYLALSTAPHWRRPCLCFPSAGPSLPHLSFYCHLRSYNALPLLVSWLLWKLNPCLG